MERRQLGGDVERRQFERLFQKARAWLSAGHILFRVDRGRSIREPVLLGLIAAARISGWSWWMTEQELFLVRDIRCLYRDSSE